MSTSKWNKMKNGKEEGVWGINWPNGHIHFKGKLINGIRNGWWEFYNIDGNLEESRFYVNI